MKFFAVVAVLCTLALAIKAGKTKEELIRAIAAECMAETGATDADVDCLIKHVPAQNRETKCLRACVMKKLGLMNGDGKFVRDVALKLAEQHINGDAKKMEIVEAITGACKDIAVPDDHCEAAELYKMCMAAEAKKHGVE